MIDKSDGYGHIVHVKSIREPLSALYYKVESLLDSWDQSDEIAWRIVRVSVPLNTVDPFLWLSEQPSNLKVFWKGRESTGSVAGCGFADEIKSVSGSVQQLSYFEDRLYKSENVRYFGGMRFDSAQSVSKEWQEFGAYHFVLPRFELISDRSVSQLVCNVVLPRDARRKAHLLKEISEIKIPSHQLNESLQLPISRKDAPREKEWILTVEKALSKLNDLTELEKVVLARQVTFQFPENVNYLFLSKLLYEITPNCFHFFYQINEENAFIGASPENLYRRKGRYVESEAVAGTGKRGIDNDTLLANELLSSEKDLREHEFVRQSIMDSFSALCSDMHIDPKPSVLNLNMGRHLRSRFWGVLKDEISDIDILTRLHPTSAVGGYPSDEAISSIRVLESFDRGWYAGPIGWIGKDAAEFAVAIRSALISGKTLSLFSGAGIVLGSKPENEWDEIEQKISDFIKVLGLDQRGAKY